MWIPIRRSNRACKLDTWQAHHSVCLPDDDALDTPSLICSKGTHSGSIQRLSFDLENATHRDTAILHSHRKYHSKVFVKNARNAGGDIRCQLGRYGYPQGSFSSVAVLSVWTKPATGTLLHDPDPVSQLCLLRYEHF